MPGSSSQHSIAKHPRDLYDVQILLANEGIGKEIREAFVVYLLSHNRPMAEILAPTRHDVSQEFSRGFQGMTEEPVKLDDLLDTREKLIATIVDEMPEVHRSFLLAFNRGEPDWKLLENPHSQKLPAVRWRQQNLAKMDDIKRRQQTADLAKVLGITG